MLMCLTTLKSRKLNILNSLSDTLNCLMFVVKIEQLRILHKIINQFREKIEKYIQKFSLN